MRSRPPAAHRSPGSLSEATRCSPPALDRSFSVAHCVGCAREISDDDGGTPGGVLPVNLPVGGSILVSISQQCYQACWTDPEFHREVQEHVAQAYDRVLRRN